MKSFGLIGKSLSHSFSEKYFTNKFSNQGIYNCKYNLYELEKIDLLRLLRGLSPPIKDELLNNGFIFVKGQGDSYHWNMEKLKNMEEKQLWELYQEHKSDDFMINSDEPESVLPLEYDEDTGTIQRREC